MFLQVCVILFTGGYLTRYPPRTRYTPPGPGTPPRDQVHPPGPGTPRDQVPPQSRYTPPRTRYTPQTRHTRRDQVPPRARYTPLGDTVYTQVVCILLECILVSHLSFPIIHKVGIVVNFVLLRSEG